MHLKIVKMLNGSESVCGVPRGCVASASWQPVLPLKQGPHFPWGHRPHSGHEDKKGPTPLSSFRVACDPGCRALPVLGHSDRSGDGCVAQTGLVEVSPGSFAVIWMRQSLELLVASSPPLGDSAGVAELKAEGSPTLGPPGPS